MRPDFGWRDEELYFDNAATTMIAPEVVEAMQPYLEERYGNPETVYSLGLEASDAVEQARHIIAELLGCKDNEVFFTSGGTESNNWALKCAKLPKDKQNVVVGAVEHPSVMVPAVHRTPSLYVASVDDYGMVRLDHIETLMKEGNVGMVSVQYGNNEVGTVHPIAEIVKLCRKYGALIHCDAVQAFGKVRFDVDDLGVDMLSMSAHKIHGPMGVGAMYIRKGTPIEPLLHGGGHEGGMRSGTLAVHQIVGFGKAVQLADEAIGRDMPKVFRMVEEMASDMISRMPGSRRNGHPKVRLPHILSMTVPGLDVGLACGLMNSKYRACASGGSACSTRSKTSHVLEAMGRKGDVGHTLRMSLSRYTRPGDTAMFVSMLQTVLAETTRRALV